MERTAQWKLSGRLALAGVLALLPAALGAEVIVADGASRYAIVIAADAVPAERTAAAELRKYVALMTGVELPYAESAAPGGGNILVGASQTWLDRSADPDAAKAILLEDDAVIIEVNGGDLLLAGNRPRGTLYAVYTLLEEFWGVRWWSPTEEFVPETGRLELPDGLVYHYAPPFFSRETHYGQTNYHPSFAARLKSNGHFQEIPPEWGGRVRITGPGFVHTMEALLPPERYFGEHPEWYALDEDGRRNAAQPCWSNPGMIAELTANVRAALAAEPEARIVSVSQMDGWLRCLCPDCVRLEEEGGSPAAPVVHAVNWVAEGVAGEYPGVMIETLAYVYSQKPPMNMRVRDNVLIRLCAYLNDFSHPYDSPVNAEFRDDLLNWRRIAANLAIWDYIANFSNYLIPHPNLSPLGDNIRFFADNHVGFVFSQGDIGTADCGDFIQLKAWVIAHLLWNPALDQRALMREFLHGYYSPSAGEMLLGVIDDLERDFAASGKPLGCYRIDSNDWLTAARLSDIFGRFAAEEGRLAGLDAPERAILAERLRRARLPFDLAWLNLPQRSGWNPGLTEEERRADLALWEEVRSLYEAAGVVDWSETVRIGELYRRMPRRLAGPRLLRRSGDVPAFCAGLSDADWYEFSADDFELQAPGRSTFVEADAASPYGRAVRMPDGLTTWSLTLPLPSPLGEAPGNRWDAYVEVRGEGDAPDGREACRFGFFDWGKGVEVPVSIPFGEIKGGYRWKKVEDFAIGPDQRLFAGPVAGSGSGNIFISRIILVRRHET